MALTYEVHGTLRNGAKDAVMVYSMHVDAHGRQWWEQRPKSENTRHLARDYVCGETFESISNTWLPVDWRVAQVVCCEDPQAEW